MVTSLKLASALLFFVGAHVLVPRIADAAAMLNQPVAAANRSSNIELNNQNLNQVQVLQNSYSEYEPPNYGGPDSEHASGTR
ncbi:hypothetical protein DSM106972_042690 [Dulcicalothrix desertica PCC 7102]|uniref:Uncharacterized protein n=1 Tax=Dulcicalothrix desertica PCC 7102 TaxID=232991 RepID=A0A3S1CCY1_9CYAN|nr:hypothetical protein [Dulcicalothrix desertica]RUT04700.1 hypothetical protein DSM106972_042690 [Dulcicalothrix desertica PCC 7102]TWH42707.1 hypothetical protein CAL7102_06382 [Dulcicalothrix desertica PCC 7102]